MADEVDLANDLAEHALQAALRQARTGNKLPPKGSCYFCDAELPMEANEQGVLVNKRLFCDADCAQDWEREQRAKTRR